MMAKMAVLAAEAPRASRMRRMKDRATSSGRFVTLSRKLVKNRQNNDPVNLSCGGKAQLGEKEHGRLCPIRT